MSDSKAKTALDILIEDLACVKKKLIGAAEKTEEYKAKFDKLDSVIARMEENGVVEGKDEITTKMAELFQKHSDAIRDFKKIKSEMEQVLEMIKILQA